MAEATDQRPRRNLPPRSTDERVIAGVCAGLARSVGIEPAVARIAAIVLAVTGSGLPLYLLAVLLLPAAPTATGARDEATEPRRGVGLALTVVGVVLTQHALGLGLPAAFVWPAVTVGIGIGVVVWQARPQLEGTRVEALRIGAGIVVVGGGVAAFVAGNVSLDVVRDSIVATGLVIGGVALIVGPWIAVLMRERAEERRARLRADARADMAAHLHDSVLQTFALIQRSDDTRTIHQLARQQERELRRWLYADRDDPSAATVRSAVEAAAATVEDRFDVIVDAVVVGDRPLDPRVESLVAALGEAATNAAKWSGCDRVSVFVEVDDDGVRGFVRDTGVGFDPSGVDDDRLGVRESIHGRMARVGGSASIRTAPGDGTEVEVFVPLAAATTPGDTV